MNTSRGTLFGIVLATAVGAQTTHLVGPGGLPQIRDALAIAVNGDVIAVQAGTYAHFEVTLGVTIRALVPGTVMVLYNAAYTPPGCGSIPACVAAEGATRFVVPAGQVAHVVGLRFQSDAVGIPPFATVEPRVEVLGGRVTFDDCRFRSTKAQALLVDQATVHLQNCIVENMSGSLGYAGLRAVGSSVTAVGGQFTGAAPTFGPSPPGDGIVLTNSTLVGSSLHARGGPGSGAAPGIRGDAGSSLWLADATVQGSGTACALIFAGTRQLARITWLGNVCGVTATDEVLGVSRPLPLQLGTTFTLGYRTNPNGFVLVLASPQLDTLASGLFVPALELGLGGLVDGGIVPANGSGLANATYPIPAVPALLAASFWFQGLTGFTFPLQASPVAGGVIR